MRSLIRLIENAQAVITAEGFRVWLQEQEKNPSFGETDLRDVIDLIEEWGWDEFVQTTNQNFGAMPDPMPVYRGLYVPYENPDDVISGLRDPLGTSWTWEFGVAINENGPESGYARHNSDAGEYTNVVLEALVSKVSVDWNYTAALTVCEFDEPELKVNPGERISLHYVHLLDDHCWEKYSHHQISSGSGEFAPHSRERIAKTIEVGTNHRA